MSKFIHIGDLHLGIKFHKRSLLPHQIHALAQVLNHVKEHKANVLIAGDVFDTVNPSIEAQEVWFSFLEQLSEHNRKHDTHTIVIPGNHDSAARLSLGSGFLEDFNIHILDKTDMGVPFVLDNILILAMPFIKPASVEQSYETEVETFDAAYQIALEQAHRRGLVQLGTHGLTPPYKAVLLAHQTFEGGRRGESEFKPFMSDAINTETVKDWDLVLAGHLHAYQVINNIHYSGSLLPYAFGDEYNPGISMWTHDDEGEFKHTRLPIQPMQELKVIEGDLAHCLTVKEDNALVKVKLVNCQYFDEALAKLEEHFPYLCCVVTDSSDTWKADLTKPIAAFGSLEEALGAFCEQLEVPKFNEKRKQLIQEALDAYSETRNQ